MKTLTFILLLSWAAVAAQPTLPDIGIEEQLGAYIPTELYFVDDKGDSIALKDRLQRPVVLSLVYYRCPGICSNILTGLADVVDRVDLVSGIDYDIWTISFNHAENWELGAKKKVNYMNLLEKNIDPDSWKYMVGDSVSIAKLTQALGYKFARVDQEFAHAGALIVLAPDGKVIRYLYGTDYMKFDLKMAISEAYAGRPGPTITKVLAYCFSYDPDGRTYVFNITKVAGTIILILLGLFIFFFLVRKKKANSGEL